MPSFRRIWVLNLTEFRKPSLTEFGPSNFAKFDSLSSQTYLSAASLEMQKGGHSAENMAARECGEVGECCCAHLFDAVTTFILNTHIYSTQKHHKI